MISCTFLNLSTFEVKMKKQLITLVFLSLVTMLVHAEEIDFSAANVSITNDNSIILDGIRVDGYGFTSDDALRVKYNFNLNTLGFDIDMENLVVFQGIGIYHNQHMAMNVGTIAPSFTANNEVTTGEENAIVNYWNGDKNNYSAKIPIKTATNQVINLGDFIALYY